MTLTHKYQMDQTTIILRKNKTLTRNEPSSSAFHRQIWRAWRKVEEPYPSLEPASKNQQSQSQFTWIKERKGKHFQRLCRETKQKSHHDISCNLGTREE